MNGIVRATSEARQIFISFLQHFDQKNNLHAMPAEGYEGPIAKDTKSSEKMRVGTIQQIDKISSQFEGGAFETGILSWRG